MVAPNKKKVILFYAFVNLGFLAPLFGQTETFFPSPIAPWVFIWEGNEEAALSTYMEMLEPLAEAYKQIHTAHKEHSASTQNDQVKQTAVTIPGRLALAAMPKPLSAREEAIINALIQNEPLRKQLANILGNIQQVQKGIARFWEPFSQQEKDFLQSPYPWFLPSIHESEAGMEAWYIFMIMVLFAGTAPLAGLLPCLVTNVTITASSSAIAAYVCFCLVAGAYYLSVHSFRVVGQTLDATNTMQRLLRPFHTLTLNLEHLQTAIASDATLRELLPEAARLLTIATPQTEKLADLLSSLRSSTFANDNSYFSNRLVPAVFKKMLSSKGEFIQSIELLGRIDAYVTLANKTCEAAKQP